MVQLALNQGPQDALLYDNSRSYFTNVGYTRTSNFQIEYRDVDSQSGGDFGSTLQFVLPKAADLLGPVDLMIDLPTPTDADSKLQGVTAEDDVAYAAWVDEVGLAAIEKVTFTVGSNDIESITGEQLQIRNELMTSDEMRLGFDQIQKTGRRPFSMLDASAGGIPTAGYTIKNLSTQTLTAGGNMDSGTASTHATPNRGILRVKPFATATDDQMFIAEYDTRLFTSGGDLVQFSNTASDLQLHTTAQLKIRQFGSGFRNGKGKYTVQKLTTAGVTAFEALITSGKDTNGAELAKLGFTDAVGTTSSLGTLTIELHVFDMGGVENHERPGDNSSLPTAFQKKYNKDYSRVIAYKSKGDPASGGTTLLQGKRSLTIPLGLFFTTHASKYFPLAAVAGCNDVRVSVKLRPIKELVQYHAIGNATTSALSFPKLETPKLRCHYVHVTGPEATTLMNMEHVRLMQMFQHQEHRVSVAKGVGGKAINIDLSFLHPVTCLLVTIRQTQDMSTDDEGQDAAGKACRKGFFFYHGDGTPPNHDSAYGLGGEPDDPKRGGTVKVNRIKLTLNGQDRHPGLSNGVETSYTRSRLIPALHSNSNSDRQHIAATAKNGSARTQFAVNPEDVDYALNGSKNIMVVPFSLNPEGSNPAGAVNMSKVSHAKLTLDLEQGAGAMDPLYHDADTTEYIVDVHAMYWNWLQIKDGRALLSFA